MDIGSTMLMNVLGPNLVYDRIQTEERKNAKKAQLEKNPPTYVYAAKGEWVPHELGRELTQTDTEAFAKLNDLRRRGYPFQLAGAVALNLLCFAAIALYLQRFRKETGFTAPNVTMVCVPVLLALGIGQLVLLLPDGVRLAPVLFPAALVGMLSTILIGPQVGFCIVLVSGSLFGVATDQALDFYILSLFGGFTAVISLHTLRERKDVLKAGFYVGLVNFATIALLALFHFLQIPDLRVVAENGGWAFVNGLACAAATYPAMVVFERVFGVVTDIRLLELTGPHHPLIREMEEKAPGSYQHVLSVTKLAESAAEAIGANFLLVRAGAYFHDIGKMLKPKYFSENQGSLEDKQAHSRLTPYMSALIIKNHVKEGIELGRKSGLPEKVIDFIPQHHGTSVIRYFYDEALRRYEETETVDVVREEDFRYPGPKPQTIEAAIVLLADSVEAIVTSVFTSTQVRENDLRRVVAEAVSDRFHDGQFDECDLTMRDLFLIRESFVKTLKARFHHRIAYPASPRKDQGREMREGPAPLSPVAASQA
ncbi:HDIG domain-containing protein [Candidatus Sumerlaeota bacterium]|nr:HDIG domain-containing protein [Candidatus Sumerlaeota bacterium]